MPASGDFFSASLHPTPPPPTVNDFSPPNPPENDFPLLPPKNILPGEK